MIVYDIYKLGHHIHLAATTNDSDEKSPWIYIKGRIGLMSRFNCIGKL